MTKQIPSRIVIYGALATILLIGLYWFRADAKTAGRIEYQEHLADSVAKDQLKALRRIRQRSDSLTKVATAAVHRAQVARIQARAADIKLAALQDSISIIGDTLRVAGDSTLYVLPEPAVTLIARMDTTISHFRASANADSIAIQQLQEAVQAQSEKASAAIALAETRATQLKLCEKTRKPRFGFKSGVLTGAAAVIGVIAAIL